jgi:hypothetical protein
MPLATQDRVRGFTISALPCRTFTLGKRQIPCPDNIFSSRLTGIQYKFDYCDPQKHFRNYVANAAATNETLLYAIFAVSARHQSQSSSSSRYLVFAEECQYKCLSSLISALNDYDTTVKEDVFASALILRLIEEMTGTFLIIYAVGNYLERSSNPPQSHSQDLTSLPMRCPLSY